MKPTIRNVFRGALAVAFLGFCLFGECKPTKDLGLVGRILGDITEAIGDAEIQWMVFLGVGIYFVVFALMLLRGEGEGGEPRYAVCRGEGFSVWLARWVRLVRERLGQVSLPSMWVVGLVGLASLAYALRYAQAVESTKALALLSGATLGQGAALWEGRRKKEACRGGGSATVWVLIALLAGAAVWQRELEGGYTYQGHARWSGPWDDPNTFGMLMGVGVVLALGTLLSRKVEGRKLRTEIDAEAKAEGQVKNAESWVRWLRSGLLVGAGGILAVGLVRSYSRGAWVGAVLAVGYLGYQIAKAKIGGMMEERRNRNAERGSTVRRWAALMVMAASVGVLGFWGLRDAGGSVVRRAYSVGNANDFSWRKRLAAYEGALQMMADKPWFGFGWNQPARVYTALYCLAKTDEGMAIHSNDFFILGTTLGLPALACFLVYVGMALSPKFRVLSPRSRTDQARSADCGVGDTGTPGTLECKFWALGCAAVCRAGAVVLLTGFWFDGALFKLGPGATLWIFLELGRAGAGNCQRSRADLLGTK